MHIHRQDHIKAIHMRAVTVSELDPILIKYKQQVTTAYGSDSVFVKKKKKIL